MMKPSPRHEMVLPSIIVDNDDNMVEEIICSSISGGANYAEGMPRRLTLIRRRENKPDIWGEYELKEIITPLTCEPRRKKEKDQ
jgi:hypothetical protein